MKKNILSIFLLLVSLSVNAESISTSMESSAVLQSSCSFSMPTVNFGEIAYTYDKSKLTQLQFTCSKGVNALVTIEGGNDGESFRYMNDGTPTSDKVKYSLILPGNPLEPLGDGTNGTYTFSLVGTGVPKFQWIAGLVLREQYVKPGNYSDTLIMKFTY